MTKLDRQVFVTSGAKGGSVTGKSKRRGDAEYYRKLQQRSEAARKRRQAIEDSNGK
jgi:hypothetical protein